MPATMRAIECQGHGGADVLTVTERPVPEPGPGEVLIRVAAAGVNRPDIFQREGRYPPPAGASDIPGLEVAGTVAACGPDTRRFGDGERVCALLTGGGYAGYAAVPEGQCLPVPAGLSDGEAAALPETYFTVWHNLVERGGLQADSTVLIHGGSSGIGTTAIQLARAWGAEVYATAGTPEKCAFCERLGAARAINYRSEDFVEVLWTETQGRGVDVVLDMVAGDYVRRNLVAAAEDARLVTIAVLGGAKAEVNMARLMLKRVTLTGSTLRAREPAFKARLAEAVETHVWPLVEAGRMAPVIHARYPLADAAQAQRALESGEAMGKVVLTLDEAA